MNTVELSQDLIQWQRGDATRHPPNDSLFLESICDAGFVAFTGPSGLCGGKSISRTVLVIHRGRGIRWEITFRDHELDVVVTTTSDLARTTIAILSWLRGGVLAADEDSLHAVAV